MALEIREMAMEYYRENFDNIQNIYFTDTFIKENDLESKVNKNDYVIYYLIGFGGSNREKCIEELKKYSNFIPFTIVHPTAVVAKTVKIGKGCVLFANTTISSNVNIGDHCVINYNASVGHDSFLSDNIFIQPGCRISGNCKIGANTLVGSNSFIYQNISIGKECLIDALTYVHDNLPERSIISLRYDKIIKRDLLVDGQMPMWQ